MGLFNFLNNDNKRNLKKLRGLADKTEALSEKYKAMDEATLKGQTEILRGRLSAGESLDDILPDAFATMREASSRVLGMRHFYVQLLGGVCLHQGRIAEMRTGEGKTLVATLPAYLNALSGRGVHVVTVNDYLAKRDAEWMGKVYTYLGLTVGVVVPGMKQEEKQAAYRCDITHATNNELGFDYLRDNMAVRKEALVQRELSFAIVDEVDSILIDEARTPLIISGQGEESSETYLTAQRFVRTLKEEDYTLNEEDKKIALTEDGIKKAEKFFLVDNLSDVENTETNHHINQALRANFIMKRDGDYIVEGDDVLIVDENTGRILPGRRYSDGLHQAIEAKENVKIQNENKTMATITFQNYFRLYKKLSGMTGTAKTEEEEFNNIYNLDVVTIPTNLDMIRTDEPDIIFKTIQGKLRSIVDEVAKCYEKKQPVLVGTITVEKSEELSSMLKKRKIPHNVLNAKNHAQEADIVAQAGRIGQVTIATNMAGRGTDILLGGNPEYMAKARMKKDGFLDELIVQSTSHAITDDREILHARDTFKKYYDEFRKETDKEKAEVIELGGLRIVGSERHESRRIDNQLRGRAGRQGDPGSSVFYLATDDDLTRIYGGEVFQSRLAKLFSFMRIDEDTPIQSKMLTKQFETAQRRIEARNFGMRKRVLQYDDVMNNQRSEVYADRQKVLSGESVHELVVGMIPPVVDSTLRYTVDENKPYTEWDIDGINKVIEERLLPIGSNFLSLKMAETLNLDEISARLVKKTVEEYEKKCAGYREQGIRFDEIERRLLLNMVDRHWTDHIDAMDQLRKGVGLKAYAQQDPIVYYKKEGYDMYAEMTDHISNDVVLYLLKITVEVAEKMKAPRDRQGRAGFANEKQEQKPKLKQSAPAIPLNANCPCGSRKKYKHCCGKHLVK